MKMMIKIFKKIYRIVNLTMYKTHWFNDVMFADCQKFWKQREMNLDIVNLGSSSAKYGFDYTGLNIKAANWAMQPQTFVADLAIIENYCSYLKHGTTVIIPLCPFSSLGGGNEDLAGKYYSVLRFISIAHASHRHRDEVMKIKNNPIMYFPLMAIPSEIKNFLFKAKESVSQNFETDANNWITSWKKEFSLYNLHNPFALINQDRFNDSVEALNNLLKFCIEHEYKPVLVLPPMSIHLSSKLDDNFRKQFIYDFIKKVNTYDIPFLNYIDDSEFLGEENYMNAYLIGKNGRKKFTRRVLSDLGMI